MTVKVPGHVPDGFALRSRVDDYLFTAEADGAAIERAEQEPDVDAVSPGKRLRPQD